MLIAILTLGCLEVSDVRMPKCVSPGERFGVTVYVVGESDQTAYGDLGTLTPGEWSVETAGYSGFAAGRLNPSRSCSAWPEFNDPAPEGFPWRGFVTDGSIFGRGAYQADLYCQPDNRSGGRRLVFVIGACDGSSGSRWEELDRREVWVQLEGDSEVIHLSWGRLKAMS